MSEVQRSYRTLGSVCYSDDLKALWWNEKGLQNGVAAARMHSISQLYKSQPKGDQSLN